MEEYGRPLRRRPHPNRDRSGFRNQWIAYRRTRQTGARRGLSRVAVPSFFTLMNLFSGFLAITQIADGRFEYASWLIVLAGFFDVLDGMMARLTNATSLFGIELDSLADVVSFGVAPSFLVYSFGLQQFGVLGLLVAALPAICGAVRLARFNTNFDGEKKEHFVGLPIPGAAIFIVALILNFSQELAVPNVTAPEVSALMPIVFVLSFLMISNIPFDSVPKPTPGYVRNHPRKSALFAIAGLVIVFFWHVGLLVVLTIYLLIGIGRAVYLVVQAVANAPLESD
ncbi:MAG: CDP-diacylglycerol--serine O-phosphatidyltransferase [Rhodothermales bacterium]